MTGRRRGASTVALAALIGTQLGQATLVGRDSPLGLASSAASVAALVGIVQTPGVSRFFVHAARARRPEHRGRRRRLCHRRLAARPPGVVGRPYPDR